MKSRADLYYYTPTFTGAVITASIFLAFFALHMTLLLRTRTWFCAPLAIGALSDAIGFAARCYSHSHKTYSRTNAGPLVALILQAVLILLAPILFAATVYMFLGRIIRATGHTALSPLNINYVTKIFVWCDVILLNLQSTGASLFTNSRGRAWMVTLGRAIVLVGLVAQILTFGFFVVVAGVWHRRMKRRSGQAERGAGAEDGFRWERYMAMLYVVSGIITGRNFYRVAEFAMGEDGYLNMHEWPIFAFDAALMGVVLVVCSFWYVGTMYDRVQQRESMELMVDGEQRTDVPSSTQKKSRVGATVFSVFNVLFLGVPWLVRKLVVKR